MTYVTDAQWQEYKDIINGVHDDFNQDTLTWKKFTKSLNRYSEDDSKAYTDISLKCLVQYNMFRTWPMTKETDSGALDKESIAVYLNSKYLSDLGYMNVEGSFEFDPGNDKFVFKGQEYRSAGETPVAQAKDEPLLTILILKRTPTNTASDKY